jgi:hypothetical protein
MPSKGLLIEMIGALTTAACETRVITCGPTIDRAAATHATPAPIRITRFELITAQPCP